MNDEQIQEATTQAALPSNRWLLVVTVGLFCALGVTLALLWRESRLSRQMAARNAEITASLNLTRGQVEALNAKLNALSAAPAVEPALPAAEVSSPAPQPSAAKPQRRAVTRAKVKPQATEDPRWQKLHAELADQRKQITATQQQVEKTRTELADNLKSTRDELGGSIARTHEELVALQKRGERNYHEFDLVKSKQFQRVGPISIAVRKAHTKKLYCDLELLVDDMKLTKKHVNLYEPVLFYPAGYAQALELVINQIDKDRAHGYVSEPKYKPAELAARTPADTPGTSSSEATLTLQHRSEDPR